MKKRPACFERIILFAGVVLATAGPDARAQSDRAPDGTEWRWLGGNPDEWQYSALKQIDSRSVPKLGLAWYADLPTAAGLVGNPQIADDTVYQSGPGGQVFANDLRTGAQRWVFAADSIDRTHLSFSAQWAWHFNRGLAIDAQKVYVASGDCRLFALDRHSGKQVWEAQSCDPTRAYGIVGAPRLGGGKVFIGNTNTEFGTERGFLDAFDAASGRHLWRFYTIPGDPAKGFENEAMAKAAKTWGTDYWKRSVGSANVWEAITYDEKLNLVYIGAGNPAPMSPDKRAPDAGAELYSDSILALKADTGEYVWHYQLEQHDGWDGDAAAHIMIAEIRYGGAPRRVVMQAAKNGFFYVLDAKTGKLLSAQNYVPSNWASGVNEKTGRISIRPEGRYWEQPNHAVVQQPGTMGAHSWTLMAYDPTLRTVYIPAFIWPLQWLPQSGDHREKDPYYGMRPDAQFKAIGKLIAWDPVAQREKWHVDRKDPLEGGVLATAGDLVFQGTTEGTFDAFRAQDGARLWTYDTHAAILGAPATVQVDGQQYIVVPAGDAGANPSAHVYYKLTSQPRSQGRSRLLAFKLGGTAALPIAVAAKSIPKPYRERQPAELAELGKQLFQKLGCYACHGFNAEKAGTSIPDLRFASKETYDAMHDIVVAGLYIPAGMPAFPQVTDAQLDSIKAFLTNQAWAGYEAQAAKVR